MKNVFQVHRADADGKAVLRWKPQKGQVLEVFAKLPPRLVAIEAPAGANFWGRELTRFRHGVRVIPPIYVEPVVKRRKNDGEAERGRTAATSVAERFRSDL